MVSGSRVNLLDSIYNMDNMDNMDNIEDSRNSMNEANKLFMKQVDKKVVTMDNFVIKTSPPQDEMILPKTKDLNLKDPKYKKKDIKRGANSKYADTNAVIDVKVSKKEKSDIEILLSSNN
jgi:hypothetical protein